ncbi:MAG: DNA repair protein RecO [Acholeplasmataceae bacterium]
MIYRVQPYLESARLLFCYTPSGKKTLLAQGAQKLTNPNRIIGQYLTHIAFKDYPKSFIHLSEAKVLDDFQALKADYDRTKQASLILSIVDTLVVDRYEHRFIFDQALAALKAERTREASLSFALKVLRPLGYPLNFKGDGRKVRGLSIEKGGILYAEEGEGADLALKETITLMKLNYTPYDELEAIDENEWPRIRRFILDYYRYYLQTTLKALRP